LLRRPDVPPGVKLLVARLLLFAGRDGRCNPSQATLAAELGVSKRQVTTYVAQAKELALISTRRTQKSSFFIIHEANFPSQQTGSMLPGREEEYCQQKDVLRKEVLGKEEDRELFIYMARASSNSATDLPNLRSELHAFMGEEPPDDIVARVWNAARGASEEEIVEALAGKRHYMDTDAGPQSWFWFPVVIADYFDARRNITLSPEQRQWFDSFWDEYPRQIEKLRAQQEFARSVRDEETFRAVMAGLAAYQNEWSSRDEEMISYPANWLRNRCWEDFEEELAAA
jgi:hypothetical protein